VTGKEVLRVIREHGGVTVHCWEPPASVPAHFGKGTTTVPVHAGEDLRPGTLRQIEKDLEPCLWPGWLTGR